MTNEQIQALQAAAEKAIPAIERLSMMPSDELFDYALLNEKGDVDIANNFVSQANPVAILSLLVERDDDKKRIAELEGALSLASASFANERMRADALEARTLTVKLPLESLPKTEAFWSVMYDLMYQTKRKPHENWNVSLAFSEAKELAAYLNEVMPFRDAAGITLVVGE